MESPERWHIRNVLRVAADVDRIGNRAERILRQAAYSAARQLSLGTGPATRQALEAQLAQIFLILQEAGTDSYNQFIDDLAKRVSPWSRQSSAEIRATISQAVDDGIISQEIGRTGAAAGITTSGIQQSIVLSQAALQTTATMGPLQLAVVGGSKQPYSIGREFARAFIEPDGSTTQQAFEKAVRSMQDKFDQAVKAAVINGQTNTELVNELLGEGRGITGTLAPNLRQVNTAARTGANSVANAIQNVQLQDNEIIEYVRYTATLDNRTSPICRSLDGKVYEKGDSPNPPLHWNCRSTLLAHVPGRERGSRSMTMAVVEDDGKVRYRGAYGPQDGFTEQQKRLLELNKSGNPPDYNTWLKAQPEAAQQDILGKKGAERFSRSGSLTRSATPSTKKQLATLPKPVPASKQRQPRV